MAGVEFGLTVPSEALDKTRRHLYMEDVKRLLDYVKEHYESAWVVDHLQFGDMDVLEGWTALSYLAALYPELKWGHTVICQSFRNPALVAKMGATLQVMSGGRFVLGMGAGWNEEEYVAYGYDFSRAGVRVEQLDEALRIIKAMWTEERVTFEGKYYRVREAWCEPKPEPVPPILVGAFGPKMLRLTARHADWWDVSSTGIEEYRKCVQEMERACEEVGRDPATLRRTWSGGCMCAPTEQDVAELAAWRLKFGQEFGYVAGEDLVGTPEQVIEQMRPFVEMGVDYFMLDCGGFPKLTTVEMLVSEVLPAFKEG
jgi:alkanesulfonate monooxygenase SsuD/methylene tetrahydromethanopterin reductase-like flavin-dependent oxidoreductase (luciferase family)